MTTVNFLQKLQAAGLPVSTADDSGDCTFWRAFTPAEQILFNDIIDPSQASARARLAQSRVTAKAIPSWSTWTQAEWQTYFDTNLSTTQVATVTTIAIARTMLNRQNLVIQNLVKLVLAMRDNQWPDL